MWFWKIMVRFFMSLDTILFNFISELYNLLIAISRTSILTQGDIAEFAGRIELLLGIFMLFKLSFSLITYIVNPDDFSDKSKGFGKLIQNAVVSLAMLVLVPYIFQMAYSLQAKILDDNLLAKLILGENVTTSDGEENVNIIDSAGDIMAFQVMLPFFKPRVAVAGLSECINLYADDGVNEKCKQALSSAGLKDPNLDNYVYGIENQSLGLTFRANTALSTTNKDGEEQFIIDYKYPISTVVAVVVCLLLVTFCIDIGLRSVKLAFLQLIYPIPVIAYMDPKAGKDGIFKKWYQMCISTFLSLFIRLIALYFGVYIIAKVADFGMYDIINGSQITNGFVIIFVIIGVLMFVKQLPKILENLGIKLDGDGKFTLNPLKKIEEGAAGGKRITGAAAGALTGFAGNKGLRRFTGAIGGASRGVLENNGYKEQQKRQADVNRKLRQARRDGYGFMGRLNESYGAATGAETGSERFENRQKYLESKKKFDEANLNYAKGVRSHIMDELNSKAESELKDNHWRTAQANLRTAQAEYQVAQNSGNAAAIETAKENLAKAEDAAYQLVLTRGAEDGYMKSGREQYNIRINSNPKLAKEAKLTTFDSAPNDADMKQVKDNSQAALNKDNMELYKVTESDEAARHRGNKTAAEAKKINFK